MTVEWAELKAAELRALAAEDTIVVVPVAATEQHGPHLPVMTDSLLCGTVARRGAERAAAQAAGRQPAVVAPAVWSGLSEHHMPFGGTLSLDFPAFDALIRGVCRALERHGFGRILLLNGHGGNEAALHLIVEQLSPHCEAVLATASYWHLARLEFAEILERQSGVQHACEAETSMVLALRPELVDRARFAEARFEEGKSPATGVYRWRSFAKRTASGVVGDPTAASAEKGERLLDAAAAALAGLLLNEAFWQRG
jgi:creatinine amidohydrolase